MLGATQARTTAPTSQACSVPSILARAVRKVSAILKQDSATVVAATLTRLLAINATTAT